MLKDKKWWNRFQLILLLAIFSAPLLGAYYAYSTRDSRTFNTVNNGEFYPKPQDLKDIKFLDKNGTATLFNSFEKKWYVVVVADGACDQVCEAHLNEIARLRAMQGKNLHRVVSLFAHHGLDDTNTSELSEKYKVSSVKATNADDFQQWLQPFYQARGQESFDSTRIYLIDPLKKLMMSYPGDTDPKAIYKDMKRLLKTSQIG